MKGTGPIMVLPARLLWSLRESLAERGIDPEGILYDTGERTGRSVASSSENRLSPDAFTDFLYNHLMESGLGRPKVVRDDEGYRIEVEETTESLDGKASGCHYTAGYITGIASGLLDARFTIEERECISGGAGSCLFLLRRS